MSDKDIGSNPCINCSVKSCRYNDEKGKCTLSNIQVGCMTNENYCNDSGYTMCDSFRSSTSEAANLDYELAEEIMDYMRT